jgi:hypothetical protein
MESVVTDGTGIVPGVQLGEQIVVGWQELKYIKAALKKYAIPEGVRLSIARMMKKYAMKQCPADRLIGLFLCSIVKIYMTTVLYMRAKRVMDYAIFVSMMIVERLHTKYRMILARSNR